MSATQSFGGWGGRKLSVLKHFRVENIPESVGWSEERPSRFAVQTEGEGVGPIVQIIVAESVSIIATYRAR